MGHLGVVLYEYLGEEYPEVLGSILGALKAIVNVIGMSLSYRISLWLWVQICMCVSYLAIGYNEVTHQDAQVIWVQTVKRELKNKPTFDLNSSDMESSCTCHALILRFIFCQNNKDESQHVNIKAKNYSK